VANQVIGGLLALAGAALAAGTAWASTVPPGFVHVREFFEQKGCKVEWAGPKKPNSVYVTCPLTGRMEILCYRIGPKLYIKRDFADAVSRGGARTIRVEATCYSLRGRTALGTVPRVGTVAVDPKVIPLRSLLYVEGYGYGRAEDTGAIIKGYKIDVWKPTADECRQWGRRWVGVTVGPQR